MTEKHTCKICLTKVSQLQRHLTIKHNKMNLCDYLIEYKCQEEYHKINEVLKKIRSENTPWSINFYLKRGHTLDEAKAMLDEKRKSRKKPQTTPSEITHWINKGYSISDAEDKVLQYKKAIGKVPTLEKYIDQYGKSEGNKKWHKYKSNIAERQNVFLKKASPVLKEAKLIRWVKNSKTKNGPVRKFYSYKEYDEYWAAVKTATKLSIVVYKELIDPSGKNLGIIYGKNGYALDHKFSIYGGFVNRIHPLLIGCYQNLQLLPFNENSRKGQYCCISLEELKTYNTILNDSELSIQIKEQINEIFIEKS